MRIAMARCSAPLPRSARNQRWSAGHRPGEQEGSTGGAVRSGLIFTGTMTPPGPGAFTMPGSERTARWAGADRGRPQGAGRPVRVARREDLRQPQLAQLWIASAAGSQPPVSSAVQLKVRGRSSRIRNHAELAGNDLGNSGRRERGPRCVQLQHRMPASETAYTNVVPP